MQHEKAKRLQDQNAGKHCDHEEVDKEYFKGMQSGDYVCKSCGESFSPFELSELREAQRKERAASPVNNLPQQSAKAQGKITSTIMRIYLLDKSVPGKEEGIIKICDDRGKVTQTEVHFDALADVPDKIRELLSKAKVKWPR